MLLFLVVPRRGETAWTQAPHRPGQYLSGFDERIRLGQLGSILESDEEVMTVRLFDEQGRPYHPAEEPYWRGVALSYYEEGRWERHVEVEAVRLDWARAPQKFVRQEIRLQSVHRDVLFGMWPAFRGQTRSGEPLAKISRDGTLTRPDGVPTGPLQYTLDSVPGARVRLAEEIGSFPDPERTGPFRQLIQVPSALVGPLQEYAAQHDLTTDRGHQDFCRKVLDHLTDSNEFDYTLRQTKADPNKDPVLDFLFNRKEGHCEYFASAMTLLLRAHRVPARVVNGFKGGDWNELFGPSLVVRQKHAHSWVEVALPATDRSGLVWVSFDPTPGPGRQRVVAMVNPSPSVLRQVRDISHQLWSNYVLNFNSSEQEMAVYGPFRRLVVERGRSLLERARQFWERPSSFNWVAALGASILTFLLLIGGRILVRMLVRGQSVPIERSGTGLSGFVRRLMTLFSSLVSRYLVSTSDSHPRVAFYDELLQHLESLGLSKQPTWTPQQFAQHAKNELERRPEVTSSAHIPSAVVDRYYRVRFGHESLNQSETEEVGRLLETLGKTVHQ
jgi:protein-glutamine gamma-glutamyltransferase